MGKESIRMKFTVLKRLIEGYRKNIILASDPRFGIGVINRTYEHRYLLLLS